jgi:NAD(P)-dependent dehydrogenase (short-subunit alcohol dehydrogenase family)
MGILQGKTVLVTGGGSGIGRAAAQVMAREGATVIIANRNQDAGEETVGMIRAAGGEGTFVRADLSRTDDITDLFSEIARSFDRLDCAFNNAGIAGTLASTTECTEDDWDVAMNINLKSVWLCMKHEIGMMLKQGGGSIVNTASAAGLVGLPGALAYTVAKHGIVGLTRTAALEYVTQGVRVNAVAPSFVGTPLTAGVNARYPEFVQKAFALQPIGRVGTPEEIGEAVAWLCSDRASFVTGVAFSADGGYVAQ